MRGSNGWTQDNGGMPMQGGGNNGNPFNNPQGNVNNGYQNQVNNQNINTNSSYQQSEPEAQVLTREMYTDPYRNSMPQQGSVRQPRVNNGGNQQRPQGNMGNNQQNVNMQNRNIQGNYSQRNVQTGGGNSQRPVQMQSGGSQDSGTNNSKTGLCVLLSVICTLLVVIVILVVMGKLGYVQFGKEVKVPERSTESRVNEKEDITSEYSWNTTEYTPSTEVTETDTESSTIVTETTTTAPTEENKTEESSESNNGSTMGNVGTGTITLPEGFISSPVDVGSSDIVCYSASDDSGNNSITLMSIANDNIKTYTDGVVKQMESYTDKEITKSSGKCGSYDATVVSSYLTQYKKYMEVYIFTTDKDEYIHYVAIESPQKNSSDGSWSISSLEDYVRTYK